MRATSVNQYKIICIGVLLRAIRVSDSKGFLNPSPINPIDPKPEAEEGCRVVGAPAPAGAVARTVCYSNVGSTVSVWRCKA